MHITFHPLPPTLQNQRLINRTRHPNRQLLALLGQASAFPGLAHFSLQLGIARLPQAIAHLDPFPDNSRPGIEEELVPIHFPNRPALLVIAILAGIKHKAIAHADINRRRSQLHPTFTHFGNLPDIHATLLPPLSMSQQRMIRPAQPTGRKPARKHHFQSVAIILRHFHFIERLAIHPRNCRHVVRRFQTPLDFKTRHARPHQFRNHVHRRQILRAQQIPHLIHRLGLAINHQLVGHPAGLRTLTSVRRTLTQTFRGQTLTRIRHTKRAMHEHLQRHLTFLVHATNFLHRHFPRQNRPIELKKAINKSHPLRRGDRHLRRGMELHFRRNLLHQLGHAQILHNHRIHSGPRHDLNLLHCSLQLSGKNQRIEGHKSFHPVTMQKLHQFRQIGLLEIVRPHPGIEPWQTKENGIRPVRHRSPRAIPISRWCQEFRHAEKLGSRPRSSKRSVYSGKIMKKVPKNRWTDRFPCVGICWDHEGSLLNTQKSCQILIPTAAPDSTCRRSPKPPFLLPKKRLSWLNGSWKAMKQPGNT